MQQRFSPVTELAMSEIPTGDWSWVHNTAERFEQAWKKGPRPRIEDFLATVEESCRPPLLEELLRVECELRRRAGDEPNEEEYRRRFSDYAQVVRNAFSPAVGRSRTAGRAGKAESTHADGRSAGRFERSLPPALANHPNYELVRELGVGGMGVVYLAHNRILDRDEVLKVTGEWVGEHPDVMDRFLREIRAVAKLSHPNIVSAYTAFPCGKSLVFAMEYVDGLDLRRRVKATGPLPLAVACYFAHQAALGLQHAHDKGLVHRDIKPANLIQPRGDRRGQIKILDFGLAKAVSEQNASELGIGLPVLSTDRGDSRTRTGEMLGTPDFIAPEQIDDSHQADIRADIYSLGCTLHFLITGQPPFPDLTLREVLRAHRSLHPTRLDELRSDVPPELAAAVVKMMAKEPDQRFQTPSEVAVALTSFFRKPATASAPAPTDTGADHAVEFVPSGTGGSIDADSGKAVWTSLIDFREADDDADADDRDENIPVERPQWLWHAVVTGVLLCGLGGAWVFKNFRSTPTPRALGNPDHDDLALVDADDRPPGALPVRSVGAKPSSSSAQTAGPSTKSETSTPAAEATGAASGAVNTPAVSPVGGELSASKPSAPKAGTVNSQQVFQRIARIPSPSVVMQARLISASRQVLFETGGKTRSLWRCDLKDAEHPRKLDVEPAAPAWDQLAISIDGRIAIAACPDNSLWRWDLESGKWTSLQPRGRASIKTIALSPDNQLIAFVRDGAIHLCDAGKDNTAGKERTGRIMGRATDLIAFSRDGGRIFSTPADHSICAWDVTSGRPCGRVATNKPLSDLAVFSDGRRVLTASPTESPRIGIWNVETGEQLREALVDCTSIAVSADGRRALIGGGNYFRLWDLLTGEELVREDHKRAVRHVAFSTDESYAVSSTDEGVEVWALPSAPAAGERPPVVLEREFANRGGVNRGGIHDAVAVPPRGRWFVTSGYPNFVRVWHRDTGDFIRDLNEGGKGIVSLAISPDESRILGGGHDRIVHCWNLESGGERQFSGHRDNILSVVFSHDGRRAYSGGGQGKGATDFAIREWDLETGEHRLFDGHKGAVWSIVLSEDDRYVLSGGDDHVAILWDARTGRADKRFVGHTGPIYSVAFLPETRRAVSSADDGTIRLWDVENGREIPLHFKNARGKNGWLGASPLGHRLFSRWGPNLFYWDLDTGEVLQTLRWEAHPSRGGSFTPDGRHVIWGGWEGILRMYRLEDIPESQKTKSPSLAVTPAPAEIRKRIQTGPAPKAGIVERPNVVLEREFPKIGGVYESVAVSGNGRWVLTCGEGVSVRLWDCQTGESRELNEGGKKMWSVAFSPDDQRILFGGQDKPVHYLDLVSGDHRQLTGHRDWVSSVAFSPDGSRAYSAGGFREGFADGTDFAVKVWDLETGRQIRNLEGHKATVWSVAVSRDGRFVLSGGNDTTPIVWDVIKARAVQSLVGHTRRIHSVAFLPDGRRAVSSGDDGTIRLWDVESGREIPFHFKDAAGKNGYFAVSPLGHRMFSTWGPELFYWDLDTGKVIEKLKWEEPTARGGAFSPDGRHVIWGGWGGILHMYRLEDIPERPAPPRRPSSNSRKRSG
jgi:WD40 repeat protein/serine/threonine protein kinase